jgi:hypothetical protein
VLVKFARDETVSPRVRADSAKTLLDRAGFVPPKAPEPIDASRKDLTEMTSDEFCAVIADAEARLAQQARDVTPDA